MATEQVRGQPVDARADVFAFGVGLYEMVGGRRAFELDTAADTMTAILTEEPPELAGSRPELSPALDRIIRHCLEKNANERFQSARDIAFALEALSGSTVSSGASGATAAPADMAPRRPRTGLVMAAAIATPLLVRAAAAYEGFARVFPFHFACDSGLIVTQAGAALMRMSADLRPGVPLPEILAFMRPAVDLSPERLAKVEGSLVVLRHRATGILMRGQFLGSSGLAGWVFLGSPWFVNGEALEASGLSLEDFPPHDSVAELLLFGQTQQMAMNDLRLLNQRLERKHRQVEETEALYRAAISAANAVPYALLVLEVAARGGRRTGSGSSSPSTWRGSERFGKSRPR